MFVKMLLLIISLIAGLLIVNILVIAACMLSSINSAREDHLDTIERCEEL